LSEYYRTTAYSNDQTGNVYLSELFNNTMITEDGYKFGNPDETISSTFGKNVLKKSLTIAGKIFVFILNLFERNHAVKSIEENP
jgi:hypothetical protein